MALSQPGFMDWFKTCHRVRFVMNGEQAENMAANEWYPVFVKLNATLSELEEASVYLWLELVPKVIESGRSIFWSDHVGLMRSRIFQVRRIEASQRERLRRKQDEEKMQKEREANPKSYAERFAELNRLRNKIGQKTGE